MNPVCPNTLLAFDVHAGARSGTDPALAAGSALVGPLGSCNSQPVGLTAAFQVERSP